MTVERIIDVARFYDALDCLSKRIGGPRRLAACSGRIDWPGRGVYFFMEEGEDRSESGSGRRLVRVGTHALKLGSNTTLWNRLSQHKGQSQSGGGNHRGSIFRLIVGTALVERGKHQCQTWGHGSTASRQIREGERQLECAVSEVIGAMPFLWLAIEDEPGPASLRGHIERNSIALLSNFDKDPIDRASDGWLGHACNRERVRRSGLWNQNHVEEGYDRRFLDVLEELIAAERPVS